MKKLIIIEDDRDAREMIAFTFENTGCEVTQFDKEISAEEVIALKPHLIIIGYQIDGTPGNDIALKYKANDTTQPIPIIIYSANLDVDTISRNSCADGFVAKPLELDDLVYLVHRIALS